MIQEDRKDKVLQSRKSTLSNTGRILQEQKRTEVRKKDISDKK